MTHSGVCIPWLYLQRRTHFLSWNLRSVQVEEFHVETNTETCVIPD